MQELILNLELAWEYNIKKIFLTVNGDYIVEWRECSINSNRAIYKKDDPDLEWVEQFIKNNNK